MKVIYRVIGFPFFALLALITAIAMFGKYLYNYIRFGGEAIVYTHKRNPATIAKLLDELQKTGEKNNVAS